MEELEIKKIKTTNIVLTIVIVLLLLSIGAFSYYTYFIKNKDDSKNIKENTFTETGESSIIKNIPYWLLLDGTSKSVEDFSALEMVETAYRSLESSKIKGYDISDEKPKVDTNGVNYPVYNDNTKLDCVELYAHFGAETIGNLKRIFQSLHYTVSEIEHADNSIWSCVWSSGGGYNNYYVVDKKDIEEKIIEIFGTDNNIFAKSFKYGTGYDRQFYCGVGEYIYDKNIEKLIYWPNGGCTVGIEDQTYVLSENENNGEVKLNVVDVHFKNNTYKIYPKDVEIYNSTRYIANPLISPIATVTVNNESEEHLIYEKIKEVRNKLENYTLTFKKVKDNYNLVNIEYIN